MPGIATQSRMRALYRQIIVVFCVWIAPASADDSEARRTLLESARYWENNARADLADQALNKYLLTRPGDARVYYELGMLSIRNGEAQKCSSVVQRMRGAVNGHPYLNALAAQCETATVKRIPLARARGLAAAGRYPEAAQALKELFPAGLPAGRLGLEYLEIMEAAGLARPDVLSGYGKLAADFPDDVDIQLAYAEQLSRSKNTARQSIQLLAGLLGKPGVSREAVFRYWRAALRQLDNNRTEVARYLKVDPKNQEMQGYVVRAEQDQLGDRIDRLLAINRFAEAEPLLVTAVRRYPRNPWFRYDLAKLRIQNGNASAARQLMSEGVAINPKEAEMRFAAALIMESLDDIAASLRYLQSIPEKSKSEAMRSVEERLAFRQCVARRAPASLVQCEKLAADDLSRREALATAMIERGESQAAMQGLRSWVAVKPDDVGRQRVWVNALLLSDQPEPANEALQVLLADDRLQATDRQALLILRAELHVRLVERGASPGILDEDIQYLRSQPKLQAKPEALRLLAKMYGLNNRPAESQKIYARLAQLPSSTLEDKLALADVLLKADRKQEAERVLADIWRTDKSNAARIAVASRLRDLGEYERALPMLQEAIALSPEDAWLRHDLARVYLAEGNPEAARAVMEEGLQVASDNPEMRFASALILESLDASDESLTVLAAIPEAQLSKSMQAMQQRLQFEQCLEQAVKAIELVSCETFAANDASRRRRLSYAWTNFDQADEGLARLNDWRQQQPADDVSLLAWLQALEYAKKDTDLQRELSLAAQTGATTPELRLGLLEVETRWRVRLAETEGKTTALADLEDRLVSALKAGGDKIRLLPLLASVEQGQGKFRAAAESRAKLLALQPDNQLAQAEYVAALYAAGWFEQAATQLESMWLKAASLNQQLTVARLWRQIPDSRQDNPYLAKLRAQHPHNSTVLQASAEQSLDDEDYEQASQYFAAAQKNVTSDNQQALQLAVDDLYSRRRALAAIGTDFTDKPGTPGTSELQLNILPMELRWPVQWVNQVVVKVDPTEVSAGRLGLGDAVDFGQFGTLAPGSRAAFFPGEASDESGVSLGLAYESAAWRIDIGTTPLGFEDPYLVGGLRYSGELGEFDWKLDFSRRAVTSTFLSYAGDTDPVSGEFWGAAREDGIKFDIARYEEKYDYFFSVDLHRVSGESIPDNRGLIVRAGGDRKIYAKPEATVFVGVAGSYWSYQKNQRFYTFGHGGYYSPQSYLTFSLPVDVRGRINRWSYQLKAAVAYSQSDEDDADYYPQRPDLQQLAIQVGQESPVYTGGKGSGTGVSFKAAIEYALTDKLTIGGSYALDRSDFYEPNFFAFYLRHTLGSGTPVLFVPPKPVEPYKNY